MKRIALFADVQNVYYTTRQIYSRNFNYNKFWSECTNNREVVRAIAYAIDRGDKKQSEFQNILKGIGFEVKLKPYIQRSDGSSKGDWDVGITIDIIEIASVVDQIILLSGDGDFDVLARHIIQNYKKDFIVYGVPDLTANSLKQSATKYYPIDKDLLL